jgi:hypothetical protein
MKTFCLATSDPKCDTCQHKVNWDTLNQMPNALRLSLQANMRHVDTQFCLWDDTFEQYEAKK